MPTSKKEVVLVAVFIACCAFISIYGHIYTSSQWEKATNSTLHGLKSIKRDCEKSGDECVMVFDFVAAKKESE